MDPDFKPVVTGFTVTSETIRPGDAFALTLKFRNDGKAPASSDYMVFVHLEYAAKSCENSVVGADHPSTIPTTSWTPGKEITDGPVIVQTPAGAAEGKYYLHVGVYVPDPQGGYPRFSDEYIKEIEVSKHASLQKVSPPIMPLSEIRKRRSMLEQRVTAPLMLETSALKFEIDQHSGAYVLTDKNSKERWYSNPASAGFCEVSLSSTEGRTRTISLDKPDISLKNGSISLHKSFEGTGAGIDITIRPTKDGSLEFSYKALDSKDWRVSGVRLLDRTFWGVSEEKAYMALPHRLGVLVPADEGLPSVTDYQSYRNWRGWSMSFFGMVKNGSALMVSWDNPYTVLEVRREWNSQGIPGASAVIPSLKLSHDAKSFVVRPLGKGDYNDIAKAYRQRAKENGWLVTWKDKIKTRPQVKDMFGAADFKPFVFSRTAANIIWNKTNEERASVGYTFDEAARCAEHFKNDLGIDKAMYVLAGWINRGYDNRHPDILPAAPECGGDEGLIDCSKRVRDLGYLFGLHDNYQDIYRDSPSWDEKYVMKAPGGSPVSGGVWAGGQAYLTCSKAALELAERPQNLAEVRKRYSPGIYFIDTTFAAPLYECYDPSHPIDYHGDIKWKTELCNLAAREFGLFGSEEGQEWGVPCGDYFEGLMSHKTQVSNGEIVVPMFSMVYGDCVNLYTHQGDRARPDKSTYILDHILMAEMPVYNFGPHLYFKDSDAVAEPSVTGLRQIGPGKIEISYKWNVMKSVGGDCKVFVHFTSPKANTPENIVFSDDHMPDPRPSDWEPGQVVNVTRVVDVPSDAKGTYDILVGLYDSLGRRTLAGQLAGESRYRVGIINVDGDKITLLRGTEENYIPVFARSEGEWGNGLNETDRFIKSTYEILSPLNRVTALSPMTAHRFLTDDRKVEQSEFGDIKIIVNYGEKDFSVDGSTIPQYGFIVEGPSLIEFYASSYHGRKFERPTMISFRAKDEKPFAESKDIKVFKAFGENLNYKEITGDSK